MKTKNQKLLEHLVNNEETFIDALTLGLRDIKFGRGERAFFEDEDEMVAILKHRIEVVKIDTYNGIFLEENQDFKELRRSVYELITDAIDLLANIDKAIESKTYWNVMDDWKEIRDAKNGSNRDSEYGDCEEGVCECEEADKENA